MDAHDLEPHRPSRRSLLRRLLQTGAGVPLIETATFASGQAPATQSPPANPPKPAPPSPKPTPPKTQGLSQEDDQFLEELEKANFQFFWEQSDPDTGLVKDRCNARSPDNTKVASIAATGFGLTALCIGHQRGYVPLTEARNRVLTALRFLWKKMPTHRGFYYHWADVKTGERVWDAEVSSIDTAMLLCGVLTCRQHFRHYEITHLAYEIFNRVEWTWLSEDTALLSHGWSPVGGFLPYRWDLYSELMMMYLLGIGSSSHPLPPDTWDAWKRVTFEYDGLRYIGSYAPLFVHQYSQAWFDFRGLRDKYADYFRNSMIATEAHRLFCLELSKQFPDYSNDLWGITASDSAHGYVVWGGPPEMGPIDGTVVPSAPGGSLPFLPAPTLRVLENIKNKYSPNAWCKYGFVNAFNPLTNWYDTDVVGIDTGITMLMAENLRTGFVWNTFMKNREAEVARQRAGFASY
ncbi:MAG: glucoamylase family protein [Bryobacteraceae bacterium]